MRLTMDTDDLLTVEEVARRKRISVTTAYKAVREGALPSQRLFGRLLVTVADADAFQPATHGGPRGGGRPRKQTEVHGPQTGRE